MRDPLVLDLMFGRSRIDAHPTDRVLRHSRSRRMAMGTMLMAMTRMSRCAAGFLVLVCGLVILVPVPAHAAAPNL